MSMKLPLSAKRSFLKTHRPFLANKHQLILQFPTQLVFFSAFGPSSLSMLIKCMEVEGFWSHFLFLGLFSKNWECCAAEVLWDIFFENCIIIWLQGNQKKLFPPPLSCGDPVCWVCRRGGRKLNFHACSAWLKLITHGVTEET